MPGKRKDYLNWEEFFMSVAVLASMRSKDPKNPVGACIVDEKSHNILSSGYNGLIRGMNDDFFDWTSSGERTGDPMNIKNFYIVHAERNAILNYAGKMSDLEGATMYVTWSPCNECAKEISQVGIKKVIFLTEYSDDIQTAINNRIFRDAGVKCFAYKGSVNRTREEVLANTEAVQKILKKF